jgi:hypothetical protein
VRSAKAHAVSLDTEARRQQALLAALWATAAPPHALPALQESGPRAARGWSAYRANAQALAERALAAAFPTVHAMLGGQSFQLVARDFWRACPPQRGDMGEWGAEFPAWLQSQPDLDEWPYLGDGARLDLALHHCERAGDAMLDAGSLSLLEQIDPDQLRLELMPGTAAWASRWPIATIHAAHLQADAESAQAAFADVRQALTAQRGESVLVARSAWRARVHSIDEATLAWTQMLLARAPLGTALEHAGEGFDFAAWLATALRHGWLKEVARSGD